MKSAKEPRLLEALFLYDKVEMLDKASKAALRACSKDFKKLVDALITTALTESKNLPEALNELLDTDYHGLKRLTLCETAGYSLRPTPNSLKELPSALFVQPLAAEIGELSHLRSLELYRCESIEALPSSLGKLTALEEIDLSGCIDLTVEGLAPLQHLTGLRELTLFQCFSLSKFPDFICNLTRSFVPLL